MKKFQLTQINDSMNIAMIFLRIAALAGKLGGSTHGTVDARTRVVATDELDCPFG